MRQPDPVNSCLQRVTCSAPPRFYCRHSSPCRRATKRPPHRRWRCVRADTNAPRTQCVCPTSCLGATERHSPARLRCSWSGSGAPTMRCMRWPGLSIATSSLLLSGLRAQIPRTHADRPRCGLCPACTARGACSVEVVLRQTNCSLRISPSVWPVSSSSSRQLGPVRSQVPYMPATSQAQRTQTPSARPLCTCPPRRGIPSTLPWLPPSTPT